MEIEYTEFAGFPEDAAKLDTNNSTFDKMRLSEASNLPQKTK